MKRYYKSWLNQLKAKMESAPKTSEIVWFVSFPKSGRTWMQLMTAYVASQLSGSDIRNFLVGHPETYYDAQTNQPLPFVAFSHGYNNHKICQGDYFPHDFYHNKRVVLLVRDPRDVVVSHYYYQKWHYEIYDGTLSEFIRFSDLSGDKDSARYGIRSIVNYMNAWVDNLQTLSDLHIVRYEDMKEDTATCLTQLYDYIGFPITPELLQETIDYGSFDNMRQLELSNELQWYGLGGAKSEKGFKTRRGKSGGYDREIAHEDLQYINDYIDTHLNSRFSYYHSAYVSQT